MPFSDFHDSIILKMLLCMKIYYIIIQGSLRAPKIENENPKMYLRGSKNTTFLFEILEKDVYLSPFPKFFQKFMIFFKYFLAKFSLKKKSAKKSSFNLYWNSYFNLIFCELKPLRGVIYAT